MSIRSCPAGVAGTRSRIYNTLRNKEEDTAERIRQLKKSKAGCLGTLRRFRREIKELVQADEWSGISELHQSYSETWKKFVRLHDNLLELLDEGEVRTEAIILYEEEIKQKMEMEVIIKRKDIEIGSKISFGGASCKRSLRSKCSTGSSNSLASRKERLALSVLNLEHLKRKHELARKFSELKCSQEMLEAEMDLDRARVSYEIRKEESIKSGKSRDGSIFNMSLSKPAESPGLEHFNSKSVERVVDNVFVDNTKSTFVQEPANATNGSVLSLSVSKTSCKPVGLSPGKQVENTQQNYGKTVCENNDNVQSNYKGNDNDSCRDTGTVSQNLNTVLHEKQPLDTKEDNKEVSALSSVISKVLNYPKVEYMHFDGNPVNYTSFLHNFESCLESTDNSRNLQLLIQHCTGKAREAIQSCVNLPVAEGYLTAKITLKDNFGLPHVIAKAHIKKLQDLTPLKNGGGQTLLEFSRQLEIADRTLQGMGTEYVSELNHTSTLRELSKKLPFFLQGKWVESAGQIIEKGRKPLFADFLKFVKTRARLVNNEFGEDLLSSISREKKKSDEKSSHPVSRVVTMATGLPQGQNSGKKGRGDTASGLSICVACFGSHGLWKCEKFKKLSYADRNKLSLDNKLCFKCLSKGHFRDKCPKVTFKCQVQGCNKDTHHTLLHPSPKDKGGNGNNVRSEKGSISVPLAQAHNELPTEIQTQDRNRGSVNGVQRASVSVATGAGEKRICLGVVPVKVMAKEGDEIVNTYALLDSGSEISLCTEQICETLGLEGTKVSFGLTGVTGSMMVEGRVVDLVVMSVDGKVHEELLGVRTVREIPVSNSCIPSKNDVKDWPHLRDIDLSEIGEAEVGLIIGLKENPSLFIPLESKVGGSNEPVAVRYSLGWTVMGPMNGSRCDGYVSVNHVSELSNSFIVSENSCCVTGNSVAKGYVDVQSVGGLDTDGLETFRAIQNEALEEQMERLWKTDFGDSVLRLEVSPSLEDKRALEIMEKSMKRVDGHYQVALPWRCDPPYLPNNRLMAEKRCALLKKRLEKDKELLEKYRTAMKDYVEKGHAEQVPEEELKAEGTMVWYLPHHPVSHPLKMDRVRVVFDCAAKYQQTSLNQQLLQGPDLMNRLIGVLSRFRQEEFAMVADIEGMFMQVSVEPSQVDALRFLFWPDGDLSKELVEYRMLKHLFGATSSPCVANLCLKKTVELYEGNDPMVTETIDRNMYVDDLMKSVNTEDGAISLVESLRALLEKAGFHLTKWYSNSRRVIESVPESERAKNVVNLDLERLPTQSALGLKWNINDDKFVWDVIEKFQNLGCDKPMTKRGMLSVVHSLFDPLGCLAPYTVKAKLLLQLLTRQKVGWDDLLPAEVRVQWIRWLEDIPKLSAIQLDRCFKPKGFGTVSDVQLHMFSDASRVGYASVGYLRLMNEKGGIQCAFVMGKARLAPLKEITIPRLELTAAALSVILSAMIRKELDFSVQKMFYWTDSLSVLKCICNETKRFHTFESNRLTIIHDGSSPNQWRYVKRDLNPADDGSKGMKLDVMLQNDRWLKGPEFLRCDEEEWPEMIKVPVLEDNDPAVRKELQVYTTSDSRDIVQEIIEYYATWWKLKSAVGWLLRYKQFLKNKVVQRRHGAERINEMLTTGFLKVDELRKAEKVILKHVQHKEFSDVIDILSNTALKNGDRVFVRLMKKAGVSVSKLHPVMVDGILRVGGRIDKAPLSYNMRHPVILPNKSVVTSLIIRDCHEKVGHLGQESVLSSLRQGYWIVKGRSAVRRELCKCLHCQKRRVMPSEQIMADLPEARVTPEEPAFSRVGIDFFGPMQVKQGRSIVKRYGCLFTCLNSRALHVEVGHSLNTDSMVNALRRFISMRGCPIEIYCDNGSNLSSAEKELKEALSQWNLQKIHNFCAQREIEWHFIPPSASHMGGSWERMVQTTKRVLKSLLKEQLVSDEVLTTVMSEAVNIVNSRPLTRSSEDVSDPEALTPNHLLHLRPTPSLPPGVFGKEDLYCRRAWRQAQYIAGLFWQRWTKEYIPTLLERKKWELQRRISRLEIWSFL